MLLGFALGLNAAERAGQITVLAGDYDRLDSIVWFTLPAGARDFQQLADEQGNMSALHTDLEGHACFIEKELKHGSSRTYRLVAAKSKASLRDGVQVAREGSQLKCSVASQPVFNYQAQMSELPRAAADASPSDGTVLLLRAVATRRMGNLPGQTVCVALPVYRRRGPA